MQSDFIAHMSHQLKTPLSLLSAVLETIRLERVKSPQKLARYHQVLWEQTERLSSLVERILEFSRVKRRHTSYEFERLDLTELVRETVEAFQRSLEPEGFGIEVVGSGAPIVWADPAALEQALVSFSELVDDLGDVIDEIEINPLFVQNEGDGVLVGDALLTLRNLATP